MDGAGILIFLLALLVFALVILFKTCLVYTSPIPRD